MPRATSYRDESHFEYSCISMCVAALFFFFCLFFCNNKQFMPKSMQ